MRRARNTISQASGPGSQASGRGRRSPGSSPLDRRWGGHYISRASPAGPIFMHGGPVAEWLCRGLQSSVRRFDSGPGLQPQNGALISRDFLPLFVPPDTTALSGGVNRPAGCPRVTGRRLPDPSSAAAALPLRRVDVPQRAVARRGLRHGTVEASLHTWVRRPTGSRHGPVVTGKCTIFTANPYPFASPAPDLQGPDTPDTGANAASCALCVGMVESVKLIVY